MIEQLYMMIIIPMVIVLIGGFFMIFRILKARHLEKFNQMGQPSVLWNHSFKTSWNMMKYLVRREHKLLNDKNLSLLSDFILLLSIIYLVIFFSLIAQLIFNSPESLTNR